MGWEGVEEDSRCIITLMCGIHGFNFEDKAKAESMVRKTLHRGPDDSGLYVGAGWSLGHNRLSVIDLSSAGHQPMNAEKSRYSIVYNGELYNFLELKKELSDQGYTFKSKTDTEVILRAYEAWGSACLKRFNGMFAFAILNTVSGELFLARDQIGIKPLYYAVHNGRFIFSSEAKAIFEHDVPKDIDRDALNIYFRLLYVPSPLTIWRAVRKLEPGSYALIKRDGHMTTKTYWKYPQEPFREDRDELEEDIRTLLEDSVRRQLVSDRPIGVFLSGGIDSTIVTGIASKFSPHIQTFSVGFERTEESEKYNNDRRIARLTAQRFGTRHNEYLLSADEVIRNIPASIYHMDEPISNHVQAVNMLLAKQVKERATVVLGGDGGDELFGGYERYYYSSLIDRLQKIPKQIRSAIFARGVLSFAGRGELYSKIHSVPGVERYLEFFAQKDERIALFLKSELNNPQSARAFFERRYFSDMDEKDFTRQFMRTDVCSWLPDESLARSDKMSMAAGIEQRVPFLDIRLVELADRIPVAYKLGRKGLRAGSAGHDYGGKMILKSAMREYIPDFVTGQPKWGWFSPAAKWLRGPMKSFAQEVLSASYNQGTKDMLDFPAVQKIFDDHISKKQYALNTLWSLITFQIWYRSFQSDKVK